MRNLFLISCLLLIFSTGCSDNLSPLSPKLEKQLIENQGKIEDLETNVGSVSAKLGNIESRLTLQDSQIREMQSGLLNIQATVSRNENSGFQFLVGDGSLIMVMSIAIVAMVLFYFYLKERKTAQILANEISQRDDDQLNEQIALAVKNTNVAKDVVRLLKWN